MCDKSEMQLAIKPNSCRQTYLDTCLTSYILKFTRAYEHSLRQNSAMSMCSCRLTLPCELITHANDWVEALMPIKKLGDELHFGLVEIHAHGRGMDTALAYAQ